MINVILNIYAQNPSPTHLHCHFQIRPFREWHAAAGEPSRRISAFSPAVSLPPSPTSAGTITNVPSLQTAFLFPLSHPSEAATLPRFHHQLSHSAAVEISDSLFLWDSVRATSEATPLATDRPARSMASMMSQWFCRTAA